MFIIEQNLLYVYFALNAILSKYIYILKHNQYINSQHSTVNLVNGVRLKN